MINLTIIEQKYGDTFTFYDNKLGTILRSFEGFEYATVRDSIDDVSGDYGAAYVNSKHGVRIASWSGDLLSDDAYTVFERRRRLNQALRQTGIIKLIKFKTYDGLELQFEAEVTKYLNAYNHMIHTYLIEVKAPDWRFYSQELKEQYLGQTFVIGGLQIPAIIPFSLPQPSAPEQNSNKIVINEGSEVTDPILTIYGPGTNFTVGNATLDKEFILNDTLISTDYVVIDVKNRTVTKNDVDNSYPDITGDFWSLIPGDNELRFNIQSGATVESLLKVSFRDAYGGI